MRNLFASLLLLAGLAAATSCAKDETTVPAPMAVSGTLNGAQEAPTPNNSAATGNVTGSYNTLTKVLTYSVTFTGLTPTVGHFHIGAPGTSGPVSLPFDFNNSTKDGFVSPITGTVTLSDGQATALLGRAFYANLHTKAYSAGEIRADLTAK